MPYRATKRDKKYLKLWKQGKSIGFTMRSSLKAKGLIPRANGTRRVSNKYKKTQRGSGNIPPWEECPSGSSGFFGGPCVSGYTCRKHLKSEPNENGYIRSYCEPTGGV